MNALRRCALVALLSACVLGGAAGAWATGEGSSTPYAPSSMFTDWVVSAGGNGPGLANGGVTTNVVSSYDNMGAYTFVRLEDGAHISCPKRYIWGALSPSFVATSLPTLNAFYDSQSLTLNATPDLSSRVDTVAVFMLSGYANKITVGQARPQGLYWPDVTMSFPGFTGSGAVQPYSQSTSKVGIAWKDGDYSRSGLGYVTVRLRPSDMVQDTSCQHTEQLLFMGACRRVGGFWYATGKMYWEISDGFAGMNAQIYVTTFRNACLGSTLGMAHVLARSRFNSDAMGSGVLSSVWQGTGNLTAVPYKWMNDGETFAGWTPDPRVVAELVRSVDTTDSYYGGGGILQDNPPNYIGILNPNSSDSTGTPDVPSGFTLPGGLDSGPWTAWLQYQVNALAGRLSGLFAPLLLLTDWLGAR